MYRDGAAGDRMPWTADGDIPALEISNGKLATNPLARANHTGTQTAATISDFDTQVRTNRLDQMTAPTASVSMNSQLITNVLTPSAGTDAANRNYVDAAVAGLSWKEGVVVGTTANITLSAPQTVDGVSVIAGDRVLVKDQTTASANGIYQVNAGAWTRTTDADTADELLALAVMIQEGTQAGQQWILTTDAPIVLDTTDLTFVQFGGGVTYTAGDGLSGATTFDVGAGTGITVDATNVNIDTAVVARKYAVNIGDNSSTTLTVTHSLNTLDVLVEVYEISTGETVIADVDRTGVNAVDIIFAVAPTTAQYRAVVHG
jgi:hypothetical protein